MSYKVFDLFCGTGGFSYGMEKSGFGFSTRYGIDILPVATKTFLNNHKHAKASAFDIRKVRRHDVAELTGVKPGQLDVIVGGPPCQGFSSIRPFRSSKDDDPRNTLFEEYASFVNYFRPRVFVLENVVGLATHKGGATIAAMEECFKGLGYDCEWRILNSAQYGVPQKRERLVLIGAEHGVSIQFPEPTHNFSGATIGYRDPSRLGSNIKGPERRELPNCLTVLDAIGDLPEIDSGGVADKYSKKPVNLYQEERRLGAIHLKMHESTAHSPKMLEIIRHSGKNIACIPPHLISSGFSSSYSRLAGDEPSVTLTVNFVHPASNRCIHPIQHRALTPREGARIQSFDDVFEFSGSRTEIVRQIGNAVPPLLGKAIATSVSKMLG